MGGKNNFIRFGLHPTRRGWDLIKICGNYPRESCYRMEKENTLKIKNSGKG